MFARATKDLTDLLALSRPREESLVVDATFDARGRIERATLRGLLAIGAAAAEDPRAECGVERGARGGRRGVRAIEEGGLPRATGSLRAGARAGGDDGR
jgi:hypothetical protein